QVCKTCQHPERRRIEAHILEGMPIEKVARLNGLNAMSVRRHFKLHTKKNLQEAKQARNSLASTSLLDRIHNLADDAADVLRQAKNAGSLDAANGAIGQG